MEMKERARNFFLLADRYLNTSIAVLENIINGDNSVFGNGRTAEESEKNCLENMLKSDYMLFIPSVFISFQSIELFSKGILLLNNIEIENKHEVNKILKEIEHIYGTDNELYNSIKSFYDEQIEIIKKFETTNNINSTKELYEALRYPENNKKDDKKKFYVYYDLHSNGEKGKEYFLKLIELIQNVKNAVWNEFNVKY